MLKYYSIPIFSFITFVYTWSNVFPSTNIKVWVNDKPKNTVPLSIFSLSTQPSEPAVLWRKLNTIAYPGKQDDICFINKQTGWYINGIGSVYHTKDGGENWEKIFEKKVLFSAPLPLLTKILDF
jgi:hypothetical protein